MSLRKQDLMVLRDSFRFHRKCDLSMFEQISSKLTFTTCYKPVTSEYKHSLTFCIRCYTHLQCIRLSLHTCMLSQQQNPCTDSKTVQYCTTTGHPPTIPPSYIRVRAVVCKCGDRQTDTDRQTHRWLDRQTARQTDTQMARQTDRQTDRQMAMANIHFASAIPHVKCNDRKCSQSQLTRFGPGTAPGGSGIGGYITGIPRGPYGIPGLQCI